MFIEWDMATVTAGDFTMELHISEKMYWHFLEHIYDPNKRQESPVKQLKSYLKKEIEDVTTKEFH